VGGTQINAGEKWKLVEKGFSEEVGEGRGGGGGGGGCSSAQIRTTLKAIVHILLLLLSPFIFVRSI